MTSISLGFIKTFLRKKGIDMRIKKAQSSSWDIEKKTVKKSDWDLKTVSIISLGAGGLLLVVNYFFLSIFLSKYEQVYGLVNLLASVIILAIPLFYKYFDYKKIKKIETIFPKYLRDISENISTGMTLPQAMKAATSNEYAELTPYVKELASKVEWGIPFDKVLLNFAKRSKSRNMRRNVQTIIEAHQSGGTIDTILKSVAQSLQDLERIKKERASSVYAQMTNGYLIYVIFLGVMLGLSTVLIPAFSSFGGTQSGLQAAMTETFQSLTIIQGLFAGLAIGKMAEGTLVAGIKHAVVLVVLGYSAFLIFG